LLHHWRTVYKWRYWNKNVVYTNIYGLNCFWLERLMLNLSTCTRTFSNTNIQFGKYWRYTVKLRYDGLGYNGYSVIADYFLVPGSVCINFNLLYKSLFTENSVATQKQYSTRINTNKIQNTTIKSITSSFFTKLNYLLLWAITFWRWIMQHSVKFLKNSWFPLYAV